MSISTGAAGVQRAAHDPIGPHGRLLLFLLRRGCRTWAELSAAGLSRAHVLSLIDRITALELATISVGPLLLELRDQCRRCE